VKKKVVGIGLILLIFFLSGCSDVNEPITEDSEGFWNQLIVYPLSWLIVSIAGLFPGKFGYGLSIIIVTIFIRILILPFMVSQMKSSKKMNLIQPELEKLRKKYSSKDAVTQQKLKEEQLKLLQKYEINPLSGCLPALIQMPILLGLYHAIVRTEEIKSHSFLWFDLAARDPFYILPFLAGATTFLQQKMMMRGVPYQNPQMQMMLWLLPVMIVGFSFFVPSALVLYWIVGNLFTVVQSWFIKIPELEARARGTLGGRKN